MSLADLRGTGQDEVGREEARVRDRMREFFPDAKQARSIYYTSYYACNEITTRLLHNLPRIHPKMTKQLTTHSPEKDFTSYYACI